MHSHNQKKLISIYIITVIVAACSIIYELLFSQLITIILGGTVVQYSLTIGTFLFSLGIGALLYKRVVKNIIRDFIRIEIAISLVSLIGVFSIPQIYSVILRTNFLADSVWIIVVLSYLLVAVIGILSGLEIPILVDLTQKYEKGEKVRFSEVLGVDYFGSLIGTVVYALILYPKLGIFGTVIVVSCLNLIVACYIAFFFKKKQWVKWFIVMLLLVYLIAVPNINGIQEQATKSFRGNIIFAPYIKDVGVHQQLTFDVVNFFSTPYQDVMEVMIKLNPNDYKTYPFLNYSCIYIDNSIQFCENEVISYHGGLIDYPMQFFPEGKNVSVLLIGGGDFIAIHNLLQYPNIGTIDHIDIDGEFVEEMKTNQFVKKYHQDSYKSPLVHTQITDGFTYVMQTQKTYDFIVLDLPSVETDKILPLFSVEFDSNLHRILADDGLVVTWVYDYKLYPPYFDEYQRVFHQNFFEAGFPYLHEYNAYSLTSDLAYGESFNMFANKKLEQYDWSSAYSPYIQQTNQNATKDYTGWIELTNTGARSNSIFHPNYNILVND